MSSARIDRLWSGSFQEHVVAERETGVADGVADEEVRPDALYQTAAVAAKRCGARLTAGGLTGVCDLPAGHDQDHRDSRLRQTWPLDADGAADPLADIRAQAIALAAGDEQLQMMIERLLLARHEWRILSDERGAVSGAIGVVLAALDAERAAHDDLGEALSDLAAELLAERAEREEAEKRVKMAKEGWGKARDAFMRAEARANIAEKALSIAYRGTLFDLTAEVTRLRVENEQRRQAQLVLEIARNEAQAAIARARALPEREAPAYYGAAEAYGWDCGWHAACDAAAAALVETETPA